MVEYPFAPRYERAQAQVSKVISDRPTPALMKQIPDLHPGPLPYKAGVAHRHTRGWMSARDCLETLRTSEAPHHKPRHRHVDEGLPGGAQPLVIFGHPPVVRDPSEGALHHPTPRQDPETPR